MKWLRRWFGKTDPDPEPLPDGMMTHAEFLKYVTDQVCGPGAKDEPYRPMPPEDK
jgi:hypothetical protein